MCVGPSWWPPMHPQHPHTRWGGCGATCPPPSPLWGVLCRPRQHGVWVVCSGQNTKSALGVQGGTRGTPLPPPLLWWCGVAPWHPWCPPWVGTTPLPPLCSPCPSVCSRGHPPHPTPHEKMTSEHWDGACQWVLAPPHQNHTWACKKRENTQLVALGTVLGPLAPFFIRMDIACRGGRGVLWVAAMHWVATNTTTNTTDTTDTANTADTATKAIIALAPVALG